MPQGWVWDATLFRGSARYYERGRLPYPGTLADALASALALDGGGRLLDVGCGPGTVALRLAHLFETVIGLDPDAEMLAEAARRAASLDIGNARWLCSLAENLPLQPVGFRAATFAQSFHWMDRDRVAAATFALLEPGGAFVQVSASQPGVPDPEALPYPAPPRAAIAELVRAYLGPIRRAGQGLLRHGTPGGEDVVVHRAGFGPIEVMRLEGGEVIVRSADDLVAGVFSNSGSAPHLFGADLPRFETELRTLLSAASPSGLCAERTGDVELRLWRKPAG